MATTTYGPNDPLAVKLWAKMLAHEVLKDTWASRFMSASDDAVIMIRDETSKTAGDKITFGLRMQGQGDGVVGDNTLDGQEEALVTFSDAIIIDQLRHAAKSKGRASEQRVPFSVREENLSLLKDWWTDRIDWSFFNQICGFTPTMTPAGPKGAADARWSGLQVAVAPDANHIIRSDSAAANDQSIANTQVFTLTMIDRAMERARTLSPAIRAPKVGGKPYYVVFIHEYQRTDMRTNTQTGQWLDIQKAAMTGGEIDDNPIFDGALGVYNGAIIHADFRVTPGVDSTNANTSVAAVRRAVLCGAQAACCAYGRENGPERFTWFEELKDYGNQLGVAAGMIWGLKKTRFNSLDFASIVMSSYAVQH